MDLAQISHWQRRWLGDGILLVAPDRPGEWLRIRTHEQPVRAFYQVLDGAPVERFERFATIEGEHAGVAGLLRDDEAHVVAMVVGDDFYVLVEGRSPDRARGAWIRDLVRTVARFYPLGLGSPRRRRYGYRPPPGWQAVPRSGCVVWLDPEFPRASGRITVHDARPMKWHAPGAVDRFLFVDENPFATRDAPRPPVVLTEPIPGQAVRASGRTSDGTAIGQLKVQLADETYLYIAQLDSKLVEWDPLLPVFEDVVRSIEPVPAGSLEPSATQFVHWIE